jgi:succinate-acetate transporter protein
MSSSGVCPYYGCDEDMCDVGCGYITSHDVSQISRYCSADYQACPKMIELVGREAVAPSQPLEIPGSLRKKTPDFLCGEAGIAMGLAVTGLAVLVYALQRHGLLGDNIKFSGSLLILISIMQMIAGIIAIKKLPIRGMMSIGSGLLWASLLAMDLFPAAGIGSSPSQFALSGYLYIWGFFCLFPLQSAIHVNFSSRLFFGLFATYLLLLAATPSLSVPLDIASLVAGISAGLVGLSCGLYYALQQVGAINTSLPDRAGA